MAVFCSDRPAGSLGARLMRSGVRLRGTGRFLPRVAMRALAAGLGADVTELRAGGPATVLTARKPSVEPRFPEPGHVDVDLRRVA